MRAPRQPLSQDAIEREFQLQERALRRLREHSARGGAYERMFEALDAVDPELPRELAAQTAAYVEMQVRIARELAAFRHWAHTAFAVTAAVLVLVGLPFVPSPGLAAAVGAIIDEPVSWLLLVALLAAGSTAFLRVVAPRAID